MRLTGNTIPTILTTGVAALGAFGLSGCGSGQPNHSSENTVTLSSPQPEGPPAVLQNMSPALKAQLGKFNTELALFKGQTLQEFIGLTVGNEKINLILAGDALPTIAPQDLIETDEIVQQYVTARPKVSVRFPGSKPPTTFTYQVSPAPESTHNFIFAGASEATLLPAPAVTVLTFPRSSKNSTLTILSDVGNKGIRFNPEVNGNDYDVAVESCNADTRLTPSASTQAYIKQSLGQGSSTKELNSLMVSVDRVGQDAICNGLAAAIAFAKTGLPYREYLKDLTGATLQDYGPILDGTYPIASSTAYEKYGAHHYSAVPK